MDLRKNLDKIIHSNGGNNWWKPELFETNTLKLLPKELRVLSAPPLAVENYNCFIYALGLHTDKEIVSDSKGFIYSNFFQKLIDENIAVYTEKPKDGDYVLYRNSDHTLREIAHIGVIEGENIVSKWSWGPLLKHRALDVPESYGDDITYIERIDKDDAKELYWKYKEFNLE